jgi:hypothetical protein
MLYNHELHDLYTIHNIDRVTKSRSLQWAGPAVQIRHTRNTYRIYVRKSLGK